MKVGLYLGESAPTVGGGYTYEADIARAIGELRGQTHHEIVMVGTGEAAPHGWDPDSYVALRKSLPRRVVEKAPNELRSFIAERLRGPASRLDRRLETIGIDFVWCLGPWAPIQDVPYATTIWDLQHRLQPIFPEVSAGGEWARRERRLSRVLGRAAIVTVGTDAGEAEVERFFGVAPERIRKLPHPTPTFALREPPNPPVHPSPDVPEPFVLYPAQFWPHKNHVGLLRAIAVLRDEHGTRLNVALPGSDAGNEGHVRGVVRDLDLGDQVHFLGFVSRDALLRLYQGAAALAYVSYFGPENLPPLEAFALGCPVVAADVPGAREQLADAALLVEPGDPHAIATALLSISRDEALRNSLTKRGRERAEAYTTERYATDVFQVLDEVEPLVRTWR